MSDTLITVVAIVLAAGLIFVVPLMTMADRFDTTSQAQVEAIVSDFVDEIRSTGKITAEKYNKFLENLTATGYTFDVAMEVKILDENPGKKTSQVDQTKIGENIYYSEYTSQIEDKMAKSGSMKLKEGDMVSASVKNTNTTISQMLRNFFYSITGNETYKITASHTGVVMANGNN